MRSTFWRRQPVHTPAQIFVTELDVSPQSDDLDLMGGSPYPGLLMTNPKLSPFSPTTVTLPKFRPVISERLADSGPGKARKARQNPKISQFLDEAGSAWDTEGADDPLSFASDFRRASFAAGDRSPIKDTTSEPAGLVTTTSGASTPSSAGSESASRTSPSRSPPLHPEVGGLRLAHRTLSDPKLEQRNLKEMVHLNSRLARVERFERLLAEPNVDLAKLRQLSWNGIPEQFRCMAWQLLMGYLPTNADRRAQTLTRKRQEYEDCVAQTFARGVEALDPALWHQIQIDVPRTFPTSTLFQDPVIQQCLARILYCWADRHPASGYVQGINDLVTPFFLVFLSSRIQTDPEHSTTADIPQNVLDEVEADSFWCLSKLLDGIQDNYIHAQPGILRQISKLKELIARINQKLADHLEDQGVEFIQFAFRWMNCLLMREVSLKNTIRMWDTYLAEGSSGFSEFHVYVCAAFLVKWTDVLLKMDFQETMLFLQGVPTKSWTEKEIEVLLSEAFMYQSLYHYAPNHYSRK
ncbi:GTPase-activating protein [Tieghemiomyces parasiticus]|uniref:GTPase-activating protein n=1 Tax=Tieghemiomyces parasiticus TaxID=78921 RepID=A0A9W8AD79_9FUNG|nr:GTPase-activating protein [Tieghemiomyces parasiticus]